MYSNMFAVIYILLINYSLAISKCRHSDYHITTEIKPFYFKEDCRVNTKTGQELCITTNLNAKK